jgi:hypothetical protein
MDIVPTCVGDAVHDACIRQTSRFGDREGVHVCS